MTIILLLGGAEGGGVIIDPGSPYTLHAGPTYTLLHAEKTAGETNEVYMLTTLTDEDGDPLVDQNGDTLVAFGKTPVIVLHAAPTSTLLHAEETQDG